MAVKEWLPSPFWLLAFLHFFIALSPTSADLSAPIKAFGYAATHDSLDMAAQRLRRHSLVGVWLLDVYDVGLETSANIGNNWIMKVQTEGVSEIGGPIAVQSMWVNLHMHTVITKNGLAVGGDDSEYDHTFAATYTRKLKLPFSIGPKNPGVEVPAFHTRFTDLSRIRRPSRVLGEVVLHGGENATIGANATEIGQVSLSSSNGRSWCIAKDYATPDSIQGALDWACGYGGADCQPIQLGNTCFVPNTVYNHASYAFNSYYQIHQHASGTCDFDGVATVTYEDPSYPGCSYPFRAGQPGAPVGGASRRRIFDCQGFSGMLVLLLMWMM